MLNMKIIASGMYLNIGTDRLIDLMMSSNGMPMSVVNELDQDKLEYHPHHPKVRRVNKHNKFSRSRLL